MLYTLFGAYIFNCLSTGSNCWKMSPSPSASSCTPDLAALRRARLRETGLEAPEPSDQSRPEMEQPAVVSVEANASVEDNPAVASVEAVPPVEVEVETPGASCITLNICKYPFFVLFYSGVFVSYTDLP